MATVRKFSLWGGYLLVLLALPQFFDSILSISIFNQMAIAIVFALSYNMLLGQGGMLSFGHDSPSWASVKSLSRLIRSTEALYSPSTRTSAKPLEVRDRHYSRKRLAGAGA